MSSLDITVNRKDLAQALNYASGIAEKNNIIMQLNNIKLVAENSTLLIGVTDMDIYLNQEIGAIIKSPGATTVSLKLFTDIVRSTSDEQINISFNPDQELLIITGRNFKFELVTLPVDKFPNIENINAEAEFSIEAAALGRILNNTIFAVSTDETRYNLNGIYMHLKQGKFCGVATDGHRLSLSTTELATESTLGGIIPRKSAHELSKILREPDYKQATVNVALSNTRIKFTCNNVVLVSKLIDANFPDYQAFIPQNNENKLVIDNKMLSEITHRVSLVTLDKFRAIKLILNQKQLTVTASGEARGMASENLVYSTDEDKHCQYHGEDLQIGFNPRYIKDVLSVISQSKVEISFKDSTSPVLINALDDEDNLFIIMPVRV